MIIADVNEPPFIKKQFPTEPLTNDFYIISEDRILVVERKTVTDFWNSLQSNRFNVQVCSTDIIILERTHIPPFISAQRIYDCINTVSTYIPVLFTNNMRHTVETIKNIEKKLINNEYGVLRKPVVINLNTDDRLKILLNLVDVSYSRANLLLDNYDTLMDMFLDIDNWSNIKGIGSATIKKNKRLLFDKKEIK